MSRADEIVDVALHLLESGGYEALSMRAIGARVGMRAPSLYKHFADKRSLEAALIERGFRDQARAFAPALASTEPLAALAVAYRAWAREHRHLYRLMTERELPRDLLPAGVEDAAAAALLSVAGSADRARALWGLAHGLVALELADRFPAGIDLDASWRAGISAFAPTSTSSDLTGSITPGA